MPCWRTEGGRRHLRKLTRSKKEPCLRSTRRTGAAGPFLANHQKAERHIVLWNFRLRPYNTVIYRTGNTFTLHYDDDSLRIFGMSFPTSHCASQLTVHPRVPLVLHRFVSPFAGQRPGRRGRNCHRNRPREQELLSAHFGAPFLFFLRRSESFNDLKRNPSAGPLRFLVTNQLLLVTCHRDLALL